LLWKLGIGEKSFASLVIEPWPSSLYTNCTAPMISQICSFLVYVSFVLNPKIQFFFKIPFYLQSVLAHSVNCVKTCIQWHAQLWGTASTSNIEIQERFQSKALRMIVDAPWYMANTVIRRDLQILTVTEEIHRYSSQYSACLSTHPNVLIVNLIELPDNRRLRRHLPNDLPTRFIV
jgi:hypothetical protein